MKTWQILVTLAVLMLVAGGLVFFLGIQAKPIPKITLSQFENSDVVVNSLFTSLEADIEQPKIFFLGIDPSDASDLMMAEVYSKFWLKAQQSKNPFAAVVVDDGLKPTAEMHAEHFSFKKEPERFISGLKSAEKQNIRLLLVVSPAEASPKLPDSLITLARKTVYPGNLSQVAGLVISKFPRLRKEEEYFSIPCNTGEADLGQTADLGCYIIQKARFLYRKKFPTGVHIGLLDQLGVEEFVFLLAKEPQPE